MAKLKILIAEDEAVCRQLFQIAFGDQEQYEVQLVDNGEDALTLFKSWHPDIILLDFMMPNMNGYETLQVIRETLADLTTTVIMVTSVADKGEIVACAKLGIQGYIVKPFESKTLAQTVVNYHFKAQKGG